MCLFTIMIVIIIIIIITRIIVIMILLLLLFILYLMYFFLFSISSKILIINSLATLKFKYKYSLCYDCYVTNLRRAAKSGTLRLSPLHIRSCKILKPPRLPNLFTRSTSHPCKNSETLIHVTQSILSPLCLLHYWTILYFIALH